MEVAFRPAPPTLGVRHDERDGRLEMVSVLGSGGGSISLKPPAVDL